jgi:hypothetical protein
MPFPRLKLQPGKIEIGGVGAFQPSELIGERQLPVEENGDELKNTGSNKTLECRSQSAIIT